MSLPEAISRARKLYDQDGRAQTSPEVAVGAWGYSSLNGASLRVLSALRQYGLLESAEEYVRLSDRALAILLEPEGSPDKNLAIREAAETPGIFAALLTEYGETLPSDGAIVAHLVRRQGFNEMAAQKVVAAFRENCHYVAELGEVRQSAGWSSPQTEAPIQPSPDAAGTARRQSSTNREATLQQSWILAPDLIASVGFTRMPTRDELDTLKQYLDLAAKALGVPPRPATAEPRTDQTPTG
jgi:hypothetical protein